MSAVFGARPTATSARAADRSDPSARRTVRPSARYSTTSSTVVPVRTSTPWRRRAWVIVWLTRRSSVARIAGSASTTVTRQPSGASIEANSQPMIPPPTIRMLSGSSSISSAVVEVSTAGWSGSRTGRREGSEPVATTIVGADSS